MSDFESFYENKPKAISIFFFLNRWEFMNFTGFELLEVLSQLHFLANMNKYEQANSKYN